MYHTLTKIFYIGQVAASVAVILFGVAYCLRSLFAGQFFCALCFFVIGYVGGYRMLLRASLKELREYNERHAA